MSTSDEYRKIAEEYDRLAGQAQTDTDRLALLDLARTWLDAAARQDELTPEQIAAAQRRSTQTFETPRADTRRGWRRWAFGLFG